MEVLSVVILALSGYVSCETLIDGIVHIRCGKLEDNRATISYFGDSHEVIAYMQDGRSCPFEQDVATATWRLSASFLGEDKPCVMTKLPHRNIYSIQVISRRGSSGLESEKDEKYLMECNYEPYKEEEDTHISLLDILDPPKVVDVKAGQRSNSNFTLELVNLDGKPLTSVVVGRVVRLKATQLASTEEEVGFAPVMCDVMTPDEHQVTSVLIDGCGTGYPFGKDRGFRMNGDVGIGPPFRMFRLHPLKDVHFKCTFVTCRTDCTMSSCPAENVTFTRSRRDVGGIQYGTLRAKTEPQLVLGNVEDADRYAIADDVNPFDDNPYDMNSYDSENVEVSKLSHGNSVERGVQSDTSSIDKWWRKLFDMDFKEETSSSDWPKDSRVLVIGQLESSIVIQNINLVLLAMSVVILSLFIVATVYLVNILK